MSSYGGGYSNRFRALTGHRPVATGSCSHVAACHALASGRQVRRLGELGKPGRLLRNDRPAQRARTTSFFVQVWTWRQWGQVNLGVLTLAAAQSASSIVWPVGVSFAVEGHLTSSRLITGPVFAFGLAVVIKNFIKLTRADKRYAPFRHRKGTFRVLHGHPW